MADTTSGVAMETRKLIQTIRRLEILDISEPLLDLPRAVMIGAQPAAKNLVVEGLCDISLPREVDTCTLLITTSARDSAWHCEVSLELRFDCSEYLQDTDNASIRCTRRSKRSVPFASIRDATELNAVLLAAQDTLLAPSGIIEPYSADRSFHCQQVVFSPNIICLTITGPGLPELSFYALPDSVNTAPKQQNDLVIKYHEQLVVGYLKSSAALIMLVMPDDQDLEESTIFDLVRQHHAEHRCLGILTRSGRVKQARRPDLDKTLGVGVSKLGRGCYIFEQPIQTDTAAGNFRGIAHDDDEVKQREETGQVKDDSSLELSRCAHSVDTQRLQCMTSSMLRSHILDNIQMVADRMLKRINVIDHKLARYREKEAYSVMMISKVISRICEAVSKNIDGDADTSWFRSKLQALKIGFRDELRGMGPDLDAATPAAAQPIGAASGNIIVLDGSDDEQMTTTTAKRQASDQLSSARVAKRLRREPRSAFHGKAIFTIAQIYDIRDKHTTASISDHADPIVTNVIIRRALEGWHDVLEVFHSKAEELVSAMVQKILDEKLCNFKRCTLYSRTCQCIRQYVESLLERQRTQARRIMQWELHSPAALVDLSIVLVLMNKELARKRARKRIMEKWDATDAAGEKTPSREDKIKQLDDYKETLAALNLPADPHQSVVEMLALPFAYYQVAHNRFAGTIAMALEYEVIAALGNGLESALENGLDISDHAVCVGLLSEDHAIEQERHRLVADRARLLVALAEIKNLNEI